MRLALLPPGAPSRWWDALLAGLVGRAGIDPLWVADAPADAPVNWLPLHGHGHVERAPRTPERSAADDRDGGRRDRPNPAEGSGQPDGRDVVSGSALLVDVDSPRASAVAAMTAELPVLAVGGHGARWDDAPALVAGARRILVADAADRPDGRAGTDGRVHVVPLGHDLDAAARSAVRHDGPAAAGPGPGVAPVVAVIGGGLADNVRRAWAPIAARWPHAVLAGHLDGLDAAGRAAALRAAHVAVVLDTTGPAMAEALAAGPTVIAHADAYASAVITHSVDGLLTDARRPEQLATTIEYALAYHAALLPMRLAGRRLAHAQLSTRSLADRVLAHIRPLLGAPVPLGYPVPSPGAGAPDPTSERLASSLDRP